MDLRFDSFQDGFGDVYRPLTREPLPDFEHATSILGRPSIPLNFRSNQHYHFVVDCHMHTLNAMEVSVQDAVAIIRALDRFMVVFC